MTQIVILQTFFMYNNFLVEVSFISFLIFIQKNNVFCLSKIILFSINYVRFTACIKLYFILISDKVQYKVQYKFSFVTQILRWALRWLSPYILLALSLFIVVKMQNSNSLSHKKYRWVFTYVSNYFCKKKLNLFILFKTFKRLNIYFFHARACKIFKFCSVYKRLFKKGIDNYVKHRIKFPQIKVC